MMGGADVVRADMLVPGSFFCGYRVVRLIGKGAIGEVYLVKQERLDSLFALKILYPEISASDSESVRRFSREAKIGTKVRHRSLVTVHDCGYDEELRVNYMVMDYGPGGNLRVAMGATGRIAIDRAVRIVTQLSDALAVLQRFGVVHRDIKPENIILQPDGTVKLVDLGVAKAMRIEDSLVTLSGAAFGTPIYIAPEQVADASDVDIRADIYSLGVVFFEMVTGRCPFIGSNIAQVLRQIMDDNPVPDVRDIAPDVPSEVAVLIRRMCVKDRSRRLQNFDTVLMELEKLPYDLRGCRSSGSLYNPRGGSLGHVPAVPQV